MKYKENLPTDLNFRNVKKVITKEYIFNELQAVYPENPVLTDVCTFNENGSIVTKSRTCSENYHEMTGLDLYGYSQEFFYNDAGLPEKEISYNENAGIDCITEYFYDHENRLQSVKTDRISFYQIMEYEYLDRQVIKTLLNSITGEVKKDTILYDDADRMISEKSFFRKTEGNYPLKNPSKTICYEENFITAKYYLDDKISSEEIHSPSSRIRRRINYSEDEFVFSVIEFQYDDNTVTSVHKNPDGRQIFKTVCFSDDRNNTVKHQKFNKDDVLKAETETFYKYDEFGNCQEKEIKNCIKYISEFEYLKS